MMKAGRELDALVAEQVMGLRRDVRIHSTLKMDTYPSDLPFNTGIEPYEVTRQYCQPRPPYSTDIAAAWEVVEYFRRGKHGKAACVIELHITDCPETHDSTCRIFGPDTPEGVGVASDMPEAICLAALKAVGK